MRLLFIYLFSFSVLASNTCQKENTYLYKNVECCLSDQLSKSQCHETIDHLEEDLLNQIGLVREGILNNNFKRGSFPNCFWLTMSYYDENILRDPREYENKEIAHFLRTNFNLIDEDFIQKGDIIFFEGVIWYYSNPAMGEYTKSYTPFHAGIAMGNGLMLQKENNTDEVFSLTTIEAAFQGYKTSYRQQYFEDLFLKVYKRDP